MNNLNSTTDELISLLRQTINAKNETIKILESMVDTQDALIRNQDKELEYLRDIVLMKKIYDNK